jgi:lysophospholipase L1-like esterase
MKRIFILTLAVLLIQACQHKENSMTNPNNSTIPDPIQSDSIAFLALGDSYTIGQAVDISQRWPVQLADSLSMAGFEMEEVDIIAQTGWTTGNLKQAIASVKLPGPYNLVSLLIGVNNQYQGLDTASYREEFRELLQMAVSFADGNKDHVIVVSIPDYSVTPFAQNMNPEKIAREIDQFNAINLDESIKAGVLYVDVTPISRLAEEDTELIAGDGLHPSGKMYTEWVKLILPEAMQIIQNQIKSSE